MFLNHKNSEKIFTCFFFIFFFSASVFAKQSAKDDVYIKYVHPRVYEFDLCDSDSQVFLGYSKEYDDFEAYVDFTRFVENDMPLAGDKITFYYSGTATKDAQDIYAEVTDITNEPLSTGDQSKIFLTSVKKKEFFEGSVSFILQKDVQGKLLLSLWSSMPNTPGRIDQTYFNFKRVVDTTDTVKEASLEKKAIKNDIEIVEVKADIVDEDLEAKAAEAALAAEKAEQERLAAEAAAKAEAERLAAEKAAREMEERRKEQEELEKALASAKNTASALEKEYLNDYMVYDEPELLDDIQTKDEIIENPDEADDFGRTLLMLAAKAGNDWQIRTLLNSGAKVNLKDKDGWTALMYAARYQENMTTVNLLIDAGANVKAVNKYNSSALSLASVYNNNPEMLKKFLSYYSISDKEVLKSFVLLLSENHNSEYMQMAKLNIYLDLSIPLNNFYEGKTPLMYAAQYGNSTKVIKALLDNNAVNTVRSTDGKTAFDYAASNKNLKHDDNYWLLNKK